MFTGLDPAATDNAKIVGRLVAAGILTRSKAGLGTTDRWQDRMLDSLTQQQTDIRTSLEASLVASFPDAEAQELDLMAQVMLFVEAREAGWDGLMS